MFEVVELHQQNYQNRKEVRQKTKRKEKYRDSTEYFINKGTRKTDQKRANACSQLSLPPPSPPLNIGGLKLYLCKFSLIDEQVHRYGDILGLYVQSSNFTVFAVEDGKGRGKRITLPN